jgi:hypothetical protein
MQVFETLQDASNVEPGSVVVKVASEIGEISQVTSKISLPVSKNQTLYAGCLWFLILIQVDCYLEPKIYGKHGVLKENVRKFWVQKRVGLLGVQILATGWSNNLHNTLLPKKCSQFVALPCKYCFKIVFTAVSSTILHPDTPPIACRRILSHGT